MGKKKLDQGTTTTKTNPKVSEMLARMDHKEDKPKKTSKATSKPSSYTDGLDLPPCYEEENEEDKDVSDDIQRRKQKSKELKQPIYISVTTNDKKKRENNGILAPNRGILAPNDPDAYTVVIGSKTSVLEGKDKAAANVKDITVDSFSVSVQGNDILKDASLKISHGKSYGLIGPNGKGKSTLLKLLAWRKIPVPNNLDLLFVEQEVEGKENTTALKEVVSANVELVKLREERDALEEKVCLQNDDEDDDGSVGEKLAELYEKLENLGSDSAEARASKILAGLGFNEVAQMSETKELSGGWRMRISLARALFMEPSLLLLDEPTNHLDLKATWWLTEYLSSCWKENKKQKKDKTLIVVSHEVDFLNNICTDIIHLHEQKLDLYRGNYDAFKTGYDQRRKEMEKKTEVKEKQRVNKAKKCGNQVSKAPKKKEYTVKWHFPEPTELASSHLKLIDVSFCYPDQKPFKLSNVNVRVVTGTRVAIVGPNGGGKSTLLKLLAGDLVETEGEVSRNPKLRIGRYSQHFFELLKKDETPVEYLLRLHPEQEGCSKEEAVRAKLAKFGLPSVNHKTLIDELSGGQKARVVFTSIAMSKPHILLLDEPTNHLDMESKDALADALVEFKGGVVLVSHDQRFISRVCEDEKSQIWDVEDGTLSVFKGTFEEYKEKCQREIKAEVEAIEALSNKHLSYN